MLTSRLQGGVLTSDSRRLERAERREAPCLHEKRYQVRVALFEQRELGVLVLLVRL
jgi:hypothetical protein